MMDCAFLDLELFLEFDLYKGIKDQKKYKELSVDDAAAGW